MASSITAAGVVFPDATVQTTAAGAGGSSLDAIATGSLSNGSTVVVNADGTVSVVSLTAQSVGSKVTFESADTSQISSVYDSANNKVVIAYQDNGNLGYGTAIVGTVSGTSISFGTPVVFESAATTSTSSAYHIANNKVVIAYRDGGNSGYGTAIVGTVSGTSISFGVAVVFESADIISCSATYDSVNQKVIIAYRDNGNSNYGTAIVGTVSGTSISFGTAVVFESALVSFISSIYDSTNNKVVIAYQDGGNSSFGTAIVGTVSGTSISFGTAVVFEAASSSPVVATYDSINNKTVIFYGDNGNSGFGTAIVGTVSGTSISFGTAVLFASSEAPIIGATYASSEGKVVIGFRNTTSPFSGQVISGTVSGTSISFDTPVVFNTARVQFISPTYDSNNKKVVISYQDYTASFYGASVVYQPEFTNLTAENYIGISDAAYTNGQTATIQLLGSVDDAQTGLTAGQKYYVQTNGTLGLTPASPSVLAGTAVSATKLVIKR
jgi:hypothetical protein